MAATAQEGAEAVATRALAWAARGQWDLVLSAVGTNPGLARRVWPDAAHVTLLHCAAGARWHCRGPGGDVAPADPKAWPSAAAVAALVAAGAVLQAPTSCGPVAVAWVAAAGAEGEDAAVAPLFLEALPGATALMYACASGTPEVMHALMGAGARVDGVMQLPEPDGAYTGARVNVLQVLSRRRRHAATLDGAAVQAAMGVLAAVATGPGAVGVLRLADVAVAAGVAPGTSLAARVTAALGATDAAAVQAALQRLEAHDDHCEGVLAPEGRLRPAFPVRDPHQMPTQLAAALLAPTAVAGLPPSLAVPKLVKALEADTDAPLRPVETCGQGVFGSVTLCEPAGGAAGGPGQPVVVKVVDYKGPLAYDGQPRSVRPTVALSGGATLAFHVNPYREAVVGLLVNGLRASGCTPHVGWTHAAYEVDGGAPYAVAIVQEAHTVTLRATMRAALHAGNTDTLWLRAALAQVLQALVAAEAALGLRHNDLHGDNIMAGDLGPDAPSHLAYTLPDGLGSSALYVVPCPRGWTWRVIDWGMAASNKVFPGADPDAVTAGFPPTDVDAVAGFFAAVAERDPAFVADHGPQSFDLHRLVKYLQAGLRSTVVAAAAAVNPGAPAAAAAMGVVVQELAAAVTAGAAAAGPDPSRVALLAAVFRAFAAPWACTGDAWRALAHPRPPLFHTLGVHPTVFEVARHPLLALLYRGNFTTHDGCFPLRTPTELAAAVAAAGLRPTNATLPWRTWAAFDAAEATFMREHKRAAEALAQAVARSKATPPAPPPAGPRTPHVRPRQRRRMEA
jgi:hypothetical protein